MYKFNINGDDLEPFGTPAFICLITVLGVINLNA